MGKEIRPFCWHQNFVPWGCLTLPRGYIHVLNHEKKIVSNQTSERFFWNLQQMTEVTRCSCWYQNFVPKRLSAPAPGLYTCIKSWKKNRIKSDFKEIFFETWANDRCDKRILLTLKFWPLGSSPLTCSYIHLLNDEKMCIKSEVEAILFKLATNDHSDEVFPLTTYGLSAPAQGLCFPSFPQ